MNENNTAFQAYISRCLQREKNTLLLHKYEIIPRLEAMNSFSDDQTRKLYHLNTVTMKSQRAIKLEEISESKTTYMLTLA